MVIGASGRSGAPAFDITPEPGIAQAAAAVAAAA